MRTRGSPPMPTRSSRVPAPRTFPSSSQPACQFLSYCCCGRIRSSNERENCMALKDKITLGMSLPHRSPEPIDMGVVRQVAQRADALGFRDLWVTENTLDHVFSFDPVVILTYAAAVTRSIRVGVSVAVLPVQNPIHVAHQFATLDYASSGRAILGVGLGRDQHYTQFQVPREHRIRRFREQLEKARRDPTTFPVSKRVFLSVHERADVARDELHRWFSVVYRNSAGTDACGVHGTPEQVCERLEELVAAGANHLLLNPIARHAEQVEALASITGLS